MKYFVDAALESCDTASASAADPLFTVPASGSRRRRRVRPSGRRDARLRATAASAAARFHGDHDAVRLLLDGVIFRRQPDAAVEKRRRRRRRRHHRLSIFEVRPQSGYELVYDEIPDVDADHLEDEAAVGAQQVVGESIVEGETAFFVFVVVDVVVVNLAVVDAVMQVEMVTSVLRPTRRQMISDEFPPAEEGVAPHPPDQREQIDEEDEREKDRENGEDFIVVQIERHRALHDVRVRRALALRHERALRLEREERRLHPRPSLVQHLAHPVPMGPNGKVVVLTAEGVEEEETQ